ncbi:hypothetical protein GSI_04312 [Ganoderma sinense ZZ0214-1]|uniref:DH domain-containing protein n=1 Tax=Ganoderma sinense ZZ0214-1 TaxID=1077348 RepID=A0A2G8SJF8_9APHY|nr:hypothetical protein GSI_04312 [Ganoderma sinense ZZ0214-1]
MDTGSGGGTDVARSSISSTPRDRLTNVGYSLWEQRTATELNWEFRSTEMTSLSENTTVSEPRSRRVEDLGPPEDYRLSTASSASTTSTSSSFSSIQSLQSLLASPPLSPSITSPPIPPRSPLRNQHTVKGVPARPPHSPCLPDSLAPIAELTLELEPSLELEHSLDLYDPDMPLLHSRSFGSISGLLDQPLSAAMLHPRRSTTPDKPLPLTPQPSMSTPSLPIGADMEDEDDVTLLPDEDPSDTLCATTSMTKREYALRELLESERIYSNDLIFLRDLHMPLASGQPTAFNLGPATPPRSSASSARTLSTASDASTASYLGNQPPMTPEDVKIVFGNIEKLAAFSEEFARQLEPALGEVVEGGEGEDYVGRLFLDFIPQMEPIYKAYITKQATAVEHYNSLPRTPAFQAYLAQTQVLAQAHSNAWDLPSLLIKPVQRLLKYPLLLNTIIAETPDSHLDKDYLIEAHARVEVVARGVNEGRRQREVVRDVLASAAVIATPQKGAGAETIKAKKKGGLSVGVAASVNLGRMKTLRAAALKAKEGPEANAEAEAVKEMGARLKSHGPFMEKFAKGATKWADTVGALISALNEWAQTFGRVIWMDPEDERSEAFDAFLEVIGKSLLPLCEELKQVIKGDLLHTVTSLSDTMVAPVRLLEAMHTLEPLHYGLLNLNVAKSRPPPQLLEASQSYVALRAQLFAELPTYLELLDRGMAACITKLAVFQRYFYTGLRNRWGDLWDALKVDEEANQGAEETLRVWWDRFAEVQDHFSGLNIVRALEKKTTPEKQRVKPGKPHMNGSQATPAAMHVSSVLASLDPLNMGASQPSPSEFTFPMPPPSATAKPRSVHSAHSMECEISSTVSPRKSEDNFRSKKSGKPSKSRRTSSSSRTHSTTSTLIEPLPAYSGYGVPALAALVPVSPKTPSSRTQGTPLSPPLKKSHSASKYVNLDEEITPNHSSLSVNTVSGLLQDDGRGRPARKPSFRRRLTDTFKAGDTKHRRSPSLPDYRGHTPSPSPNAPTFPPPATSTRQRRSGGQVPSLYECRVIHPCEPPEGVEYRSLPFFTLVVDEVYDILQEAGHPSVHRDLPLYVDDGEDCLLLVRNDAGDIGWALASFMVPMD